MTKKFLISCGKKDWLVSYYYILVFVISMQWLSNCKFFYSSNQADRSLILNIANTHNWKVYFIYELIKTGSKKKNKTCTLQQMFTLSALLVHRITTIKILDNYNIVNKYTSNTQYVNIICTIIFKEGTVQVNSIMEI